jgi:alpha-beta hydrolase superfamily lysophospholipase
MATHPLDDIGITSRLFYPRSASSGKSAVRDTFDGTIPVEDGVVLGYRYFHASGKPVIVFWHGNGEIAEDYDMIAASYRNAGAGLFVLDYRGYGWSTGTPLTTKMLPDALKALDAIPEILKQHGAENAALFIKGRSLGSAPAIYCAAQKPDLLKGIILESGFADAPSLFRRLGITVPEELLNDPALPLNNATRLETVDLPLLVIHGENDTLIPVHHGQELFEASPAEDKALVIIRRAGHNDVLIRDTAKYFGAVQAFIEEHSQGKGEREKGKAD